MKRQKQDRTLELSAIQSPRRVAVPLIVRDGKTCVTPSTPYSSHYGSFMFAPSTGYSVPPAQTPQNAGYMQTSMQNGIRAW